MTCIAEDGQVKCRYEALIYQQSLNHHHMSRQLKMALQICNHQFVQLLTALDVANVDCCRYFELPIEDAHITNLYSD